LKKKAKKRKIKMNHNFKQPSFCSRSQSSSSSLAIVSTNSSTVIDSVIDFDPFFNSYGMFSSQRPQYQQQQHFSNYFPTQCLPSLMAATQMANQFSSSTPTASCNSPLPPAHVSTSPIDSNAYLTDSSIFDSFKLHEMASKLKEINLEENMGHLGLTHDSSTSSDWSHWSSDQQSPLLRIASNNFEENNTEPRSYLSSPRPIRAIKKSNNVSHIQLSQDLNIQAATAASSSLEVVKRAQTPRMSVKKNPAHNSCCSSPVSGSSMSSSPQTTRSSNHNHKSQRELPLRSLKVDMSQYLRKDSNELLQQQQRANNQRSFRSSSSSNNTPRLSSVSGSNKAEVVCQFCVKNNESVEIYSSHPLKDPLGKVVCPILRACVCPQCGESGDYAHTHKYCPETQRRQKQDKIKRFVNQN
jgi:hypothetical protein